MKGKQIDDNSQVFSFLSSAYYFSPLYIVYTYVLVDVTLSVEMLQELSLQDAELLGIG
jgi:hypothetical protein